MADGPMLIEEVCASQPQVEVRYCRLRRCGAVACIQIAFGRFDRNMTEKKLNLFQFATGLMAQTRTGPAKIMRRQTGQPRIRRGLLHYGPDNLGSEAVSPGFAQPC